MNKYYSLLSPDCEGNFTDIGVEVGGEADTEFKEQARIANACKYLEKRAESLLEDCLPDWSLPQFAVGFSEQITSNYGWFRCNWKRVNGERIPHNFRITLSYRLCHYLERRFGMDYSWIVDSVLFHEICHVITAGQHHSREFWEFCDCYPRMREAYEILHGRRFPI